MPWCVSLSAVPTELMHSHMAGHMISPRIFLNNCLTARSALDPSSPKKLAEPLFSDLNTTFSGMPLFMTHNAELVPSISDCLCLPSMWVRNSKYVSVSVNLWSPVKVRISVNFDLSLELIVLRSKLTSYNSIEVSFTKFSPAIRTRHVLFAHDPLLTVHKDAFICSTCDRIPV
jgi:hypothetical protein